jgi:hypothetical protein
MVIIVVQILPQSPILYNEQEQTYHKDKLTSYDSDSPQSPILSHKQGKQL